MVGFINVMLQDILNSLAATVRQGMLDQGTGMLPPRNGTLDDDIGPEFVGQQSRNS